MPHIIVEDLKYLQFSYHFWLVSSYEFVTVCLVSFTASAGNEALMSRPGTDYYERSCLVGPGPGPGTPPVNPQGTQFSRTETVPSKIRANTVVQHAASQSSVSCSNIFYIFHFK